MSNTEPGREAMLRTNVGDAVRGVREKLRMVSPATRGSRLAPVESAIQEAETLVADLSSWLGIP